MKRVIIALAASFAVSGAISGLAYAATDAASTEKAQVDQAAVDALATKIAEAIKALGDSPSEDAVLAAIESATAGADISTISAALDKVAMDSSLSATAKTAVGNAASDAKTALNTNDKATGGVSSGSSPFGSGSSNTTGGSPGAGGGGGYLPPN